jgi:hypothetical protein
MPDGFEETHRGIEGGRPDYRSEGKAASNPCGHPEAAARRATSHWRRSASCSPCRSSRASEENDDRQLMVGLYSTSTITSECAVTPASLSLCEYRHEDMRGINAGVVKHDPT